jgi:poly-gamma-glutamate capsule biosynthesis protein CapA/YwtB (metallophosphatase superfamily)
MTPMQIRRFKASRASREDAGWLMETVNRESRRYGVRVELRDDDHRLELRSA